MGAIATGGTAVPFTSAYQSVVNQPFAFGGKIDQYHVKTGTVSVGQTAFAEGGKTN